MTPKSVRILGIDYVIKYENMRATNGNESIGNCDNQACAISIDTRLNSQPHQRSVLLHEVIEALNYRMELDLAHEKITQLEAGLISAIRDNPVFLKYLGEEDA